MCGVRHRDVNHPSVAKSPVGSLQDWLVLHRGAGGWGILGLATRPQQGSRLKPRGQMGLRPEAETKWKCKGLG